jgi:hypothetical protein
VFRTPTFHDDDMTHRVLIDSATASQDLQRESICKESQRQPNQTTGSPMLIAKANDTIRLMYQENGHVTKLDEVHPSSGVVTVYGKLASGQYESNTFEAVMKGSEFTRSEIPFDDGHCYQENGTPAALARKGFLQRPHLDVEGNDLWCGSDIRLPGNLVPGTEYTLYWVWNFVGTTVSEILVE